MTFRKFVFLEFAFSEQALFNKVPTGTTASRNVVLANVGFEGLTVNAIVINGSDAARFSSNVLPFSLNSGEARMFSIEFTPDSDGAFFASLDLSSNVGELNIDLTGIGVCTPGQVDVSIPQGSGTPGCENSNSCFIPFQTTVMIGSKVTWHNDDSAAHTVSSGSPRDGLDGNFDSSLFFAGNTFSHTFTQSGSFPYFCLVHPWQTGFILVLEEECAPQSLAISPSRLNFGDSLLGRGGTSSVIMANLSSDPINIGPISIVGADAGNFEIDDTQFTLDPGTSKKLLVHFTPDHSGDFSALVVFESLDDVIVLSLSGSGIMSEIPEDSLAGHWKFDELAWSGVPDEVIDSSENNIHGTSRNGAQTVTEGKINRAGEFDGNDDFIDFGLIESGHPLQLTFGGTLTGWFSQQDGDGGQRILDKSDGIAGANGYSLIAHSDDKSLILTVNGSVFRTGSDIYEFDEWTHIGAVITAGVYEIYVNGNLEPATFRRGSAQLPPNSETSLRIGSWNHSTGREFNGLLDDIRIYDTPLKSHQIADIVADADPNSHLIAHFAFNEDSGCQTEDSAGGSDSKEGQLEPDCPTNSPVWRASAGISGSALEFDGDDDFVDLGLIEGGHPLQLRSGGTVMGWFNQRDGDGGQRILDKSDGIAGTNGYSLIAHTDDRSIVLTVNGSVFRTSPGVYEFEEWTHVVGVIQADIYEIYVNGNLESATFWRGSAELPPNAETTLRIGTWNHSVGREFNGFLDDIRIYDAALEASQITEIMRVVDPNSTLIAHYGFNEGSGCLTTDSVGGPESKEGQLEPDCLTNSPLWHASVGTLGSALEFDGDDDFVDLGLIEGVHPLQLRSGGTVMGWFNQRDGDGGQRILDKSDGIAGTNGYSLIAHSDDRSIVLTVNGSVFRTGPGVYEFEEWNHVVGVIQADIYEIYVNGILEPATFWRGSAELPPNAETTLRIGSWNHSVGREFNGFLDDIRIYNTALPPSQIIDIATAEARDPNLIAHYRFNEDSGCLTADNAAGPASKEGELEPDCSTNSPVWRPSGGMLGSALEFDGDDDSVDLGIIESGHPLQLTVGGTLMAWFSQRDGDGGQRILDKSDGMAGANGYSLIAHSGDQSIILTVNGSVFRTGPGVYEFEEPTHVVGVIKDDNYEIYVNGHLETATFLAGSAQLPPDLETSMRFGTWNHASGREFNGFLDDIRIYNRALENAEIDQIHADASIGTNLIINRNEIEAFGELGANAAQSTSIPFLSQTIYEDAEDGLISGWQVYGEGSVVNMEDMSGNRIISTDGGVIGDPLRLGLSDESNWNNTEEFIAYFAILMEEAAAVYFQISTNQGDMFLCYRPGNESLDIGDQIICFGLGIEPDGQWHAITRNLASDLKTAIPEADLLSVKDFYVFGSVKLDDIMLLKESID